MIGTPHSGTHTLGNWQSDNAVDVGVSNGTPVLAPGHGVVEKVRGGYAGGSSRFDGFQVTVRLADGQRIFYTHLSKVAVKPGMMQADGIHPNAQGAALIAQRLAPAVARALG